MQSSALAAVLARIHFPNEPLVVATCIMSACTHATIGSLLAGFWNSTVSALSGVQGGDGGMEWDGPWRNACWLAAPMMQVLNWDI